MRSNYKKLGPYIREVVEKNRTLSVSKLLGVSIEKKFIPSIANIVGTDMTGYKIVRKGQFAYGPVTSRNGDKISLALLSEDDCIVSSSYTAFEVISPAELDPEYLMIWFRRPEFDRYARYMSHGSVREVFGWGEICDVELPVPPIERQRKVVREYNVVVNQIGLNDKLIEVLEETAKAIYKQWFEDFEFPLSKKQAACLGNPGLEGKPYKSSGGEMWFCKELGMEVPKGWEIRPLKSLGRIKGGKRLPKGEELVSLPTGHPYIKVADLGGNKYVRLSPQMEYVDPLIQKTICRYVVDENDIIVSIVGTIGVTRIVDKTLHRANLTENCAKITLNESNMLEYLYYFFDSRTGRNEIEMRTVGGVQGKLPLYNIESMPVLMPFNETLAHFDRLMRSVSNAQKLKAASSSLLEQTKDTLMRALSLPYKDNRTAA
ncbi:MULTISPECIES: restriction endonuclease subunit S [unclassified Rhizobium]|uniref:restriction endonuclease subunit S n=1 Tax=unclassified Rhizobium TaxID=2613769 RepID=UPI0009E7D59A|nr:MULTISPECIES: restriction endonuclease subunit S [unclassified Rhizobium]